MPASSKKAPSVHRTVMTIWHTLTKDFSDPYRPELHYMRGPGPKWREKHGDVVRAEINLVPLTEATA